MSRRWALALLAVAALGGCASLPTGTDGRDLAARRDALAAVPTWQMRGRLTVDAGDRAFQGSFTWRQDDDSLELIVRGPFRNGVLQVTGPPNALQVTARGETRTLTDPEKELSELIGWWLPVASLPHWLLGFPDRAFPATTEPGADGTLAALEQRLWRVAYPLYGLAPLSTEAAGAQVLVPSRVDLTHGELALQLTIDDWRPSAIVSP
jgi:outer membrane lipoprotein LolB